MRKLQRASDNGRWAGFRWALSTESASPESLTGETFLPAETWRISLDDRLLDHETADPDLGGYVWGTRYHEMYGAELRPESEATRQWSKAVGIDFQEVHIETNAHDPTLLFSDLEVSEAGRTHALRRDWTRARVTL